MNRQLASLPGGVTVLIREPHHQQLSWLEGKYYEEQMLEYIRQKYSGGTFIDGGACIGNHTLFFAAFCADHVLAIEPVIKNAVHLKTNLILSKLTNKVTIIKSALGRRPGRGSMEKVGEASGLYNLVEGDEVEVTALNTIAARVSSPIALIKLDIQGTEYPAIQGGLRLLKRDHPALFIELMTPKEVSRMDNLLGGLGYRRGECFNASPTYEYIYEGSHAG